ncbi:MAG: uncharacterized protein A8A55_2515 [Amphiamblys sp. WSBS2006]|nr:MAG: uncharacterized protein A8A55_2515 [Amphiamblys sp. WSBS2006]
MMKLFAVLVFASLGLARMLAKEDTAASTGEKKQLAPKAPTENTPPEPEPDTNTQIPDDPSELPEIKTFVSALPKQKCPPKKRCGKKEEDVCEPPVVVRERREDPNTGLPIYDSEWFTAGTGTWNGKRCSGKWVSVKDKDGNEIGNSEAIEKECAEVVPEECTGSVRTGNNVVLVKEKKTRQMAEEHCATLGSKLANLGNHNMADASIALFSSGETRGWIKSYFGDDYSNSPLVLSVGPTEGGGAINTAEDPEQNLFFFCDYMEDDQM